MLGLTQRWLSLVLFVSSSSLAAAAQGNVLIVGPGGFTQIQDAVVAAQDGDTILVRTPRTTSAIDIVGKALTIAADRPGGGLSSAATLQVHGLPAGKTVVVSRLHFNDFFNEGVSPVLLLNNAGSVRFVRCTTESAGFYPNTAMRIVSSRGSTALAACNVLGGSVIDGGDSFQLGGGGLEVRDAIAALYDSTVQGGESTQVGILPPVAGGTGASVEHISLPTRLLLANSSVQGGRGGELFACGGYYEVSAPGGPGLVLGPGATVTRHGSTIAGGLGGETPGCGTSGPSGTSLVVSGALLSVPTPPIALTTPTIAREGQTITLGFTGTPGDRVFLLTGAQPTFRETAVGLMLVEPGPTALPQRGPLGIIGSSGTLTVAYALPQLPAGMGAANLWLQAFARHADGKRTLGSFSVVTVLDSAY